MGGSGGEHVISILEGHILLSASSITPSVLPLALSQLAGNIKESKGGVTEVIHREKNAAVHSVQPFAHFFPSVYCVCEEYVR